MLTDADAIRPRMDVVSVDGGHLGYVEAVLSCDLKLARGDNQAAPHLLPLAFIASVDEVVRLIVTDSEARRSWRETY